VFTEIVHKSKGHKVEIEMSKISTKNSMRGTEREYKEMDPHELSDKLEIKEVMLENQTTGGIQTNLAMEQFENIHMPDRSDTEESEDDSEDEDEIPEDLRELE